MLDAHLAGRGDDQAVDIPLAVAADPLGRVTAAGLHAGGPVRLLIRPDLPRDHDLGRMDHPSPPPSPEERGGRESRVAQGC